MSALTFEQGRQGAVAAAARCRADFGVRTAVLRDVFGRCTLIIDDTGLEARPDDGVAAASMRALGIWCHDEPIGWATDLLAPDEVFADPTAATLESDGVTVTFIERTTIGADWVRLTVAPQTMRPFVVAFASLKGGVGRSTALTVLARQFAEEGRSVLLVDFDLESPGLGPSLLEPGDGPLAGVVDVLVRSAAGLAGAADAVVRLTTVVTAGNGERWVFPAAGELALGYEYVPKLDRAYLEYLSDDRVLHTVATRLANALDQAVEAVTRAGRRPDVVLVDCRAGIHDVAGAVLTTIADLGLLFAADTPQTWAGYREIFRLWTERPDLARRLRERLQIVACLVDEANGGHVLASMRERAYDLFLANLYDDQPAEEEEDLAAYSPPLGEEGAPHDPVPIYFHAELRNAPASMLDLGLASPGVRAAFEVFVRRIGSLVDDLGGRA